MVVSYVYIVFSTFYVRYSLFEKSFKYICSWLVVGCALVCNAVVGDDRPNDGGSEDL